MKKKIIALLIMFIALFSTNVYAEQYENLYKMDTEIVDNTFTIEVGFREKNAMAVMTNIKYNKDKIEFVNVEGNDYFTVTKGKEYSDGIFNSFKILADSEYGFQKTYFVKLKFKIKDNFKKGERTNIYFNNNQMATADEILKSSPSVTFTVYYDKEGTVSYVTEEQNFITNIEIYLYNNWKFVLICLGVVLGLFILIRYYIVFSEVRKDKIKNNHNHNVEKMRFAPVSKKLRTVDTQKPEKVRIAKVGKWGKKQNEQPVQQQVVQNQTQVTPTTMVDLDKLMSPEVIVEEQNETMQGVDFNDNLKQDTFYGNANTGQDNMLPDDFSTFGAAESGYAYDDDDVDDSTIDHDERAVNLDGLSSLNFDESKGIDDGTGTKIGMIIGFLILAGTFALTTVNALTPESLDELRNMIVGNTEWKAELDINNDNAIDILDIIASKDIENIIVIQDSVSVEDSKDKDNFQLKSTSQYVRTTERGTQVRRTTANGKWKTKKTTKPSGGSSWSPSGNTGGGESDGNSDDNPGGNESGENDYVPPTPSQEDLSTGSKTKRTVLIDYVNASGDYSEVIVDDRTDLTFNTYPGSEAYQNGPIANCNNGIVSTNGSQVTIKNINYNTSCTIIYGKSNTINAYIDYNYGDADHCYTNHAHIYEKQKHETIYDMSLKFDTDHYQFSRIRCNGGFDNATVTGRNFHGTIAERSGTCIVELKPITTTVKIYYNGSEENSYQMAYHGTTQVSLWNTAYKPNMTLKCGSNVISPKSVKEETKNIGGYSGKGLTYVFDLKNYGTNCTLE